MLDRLTVHTMLDHLDHITDHLDRITDAMIPGGWH